MPDAASLKQKKKHRAIVYRLLPRSITRKGAKHKNQFPSFLIAEAVIIHRKKIAIFSSISLFHEIIIVPLIKFTLCILPSNAEQLKKLVSLRNFRQFNIMGACVSWFAIL